MKHTKALALLTAPFVLVALLALSHFMPAHAQSGNGNYIEIGSAWNVASVASGGKIFATNLHTTRAASVLRIAITPGTSTQFYIQETDGTNTFTMALLDGSTLTANHAYTLTWEGRNASAPGGTSPGPTSFNIIVGAPQAPLPVCRITEVISGVD